MQIGIAKKDERSSPIKRLVRSIFSTDGDSFLSSEKLFPMWEKLEVEIVEDDVLSLLVPLVDVEQSTEVHVRAKRSCPLSFPVSGWSA